MRHIEHNKEHRGKGHQPDDNLVTLEIHLLMIRLADHARRFVFILIRAVHHLIIRKKITIRGLLLFDLVTTLSIYRKSFYQVREKLVFGAAAALFGSSVPLGVIGVIMFEAALIVYNLAV